MDTSTKVYLQGIGEKTIQIRGKTYVPIIINDEEIITEFPVVNSKFPIPYHGIFDQTFLKNRTKIDNQY